MASQTDAKERPESHSRLEESEKHDRYQSSMPEAVGDHAQVIDPEIEARVLGKIDLFLMPARVIGKISAHCFINRRDADNLIRLWTGIL